MTFSIAFYHTCDVSQLLLTLQCHFLVSVSLTKTVQDLTPSVWLVTVSVRRITTLRRACAVSNRDHTIPQTSLQSLVMDVMDVDRP